MRTFLFVIFVLCGTLAFAQLKVNGTSGTLSDFPLCADGQASPIYISENDYEVVKIVSDIFTEDIQMVTGVKSNVSTSK